MKPEQIEKAKWHLKLGVCGTKRGIRTHFRIFGFEDMKLVMRFLCCSVDDLVETAYDYVKKRGRYAK